MAEPTQKVCNMCKKMKSIDNYVKNDKILKNCLICREYNNANKEKNKCIHNRQKSLCKECGGASICIHNRQKNQCKECGGASICIHNRQKNKCKDCGGASICIHNRQKNQCKDCGGASICIHNRRKSLCKECGGSSICIHNRQKNKCKDCGGASICIHNRQKNQCKDCGGASICIHNRRKNQCKDCGGSSICIHNRQKNKCKDCGNEVQKTIKKMIYASKYTDKKCKRYEEYKFVDYDYVKELIEKSEDKCYYCICQLQYIIYQGDLATIERLDNSLGHIKGNCVIACKKCNISKVGNK
jgi:hypothetical protein